MRWKQESAHVNVFPIGNRDMKVSLFFKCQMIVQLRKLFCLLKQIHPSVFPVVYCLFVEKQLNLANIKVHFDLYSKGVSLFLCLSHIDFCSIIIFINFVKH